MLTQDGVAAAVPAVHSHLQLEHVHALTETGRRCVLHVSKASPSSLNTAVRHTQKFTHKKRRVEKAATWDTVDSLLRDDARRSLKHLNQGQAIQEMLTFFDTKGGFIYCNDITRSQNIFF